MSDTGILEAAKGFATIATALIAVFGYLRTTTYRDKVASSRKAFDSVVASLASESEVTQLAGAILIRRFFDENSEVNPPIRSAALKYLEGFWKSGAGGPARPNEGTPYAPDAVDVIAAILRSQPSGNFQKILADGLAFAPSLRRADLQRTNLHNAYLGSRGKRVLNMSGADFYRADLSGASLKNAVARGAVFYQARMSDTGLRDADLTEASFFEADLLGANFDGAKLRGATFERTRNIPPELLPHIVKGEWQGPEIFRPPTLASGTASPSIIYLSKPGCLDARQEKIVALVRGWLNSNGMATTALEREDYPRTSALAELRRRMAGCAGAIAFGFAELKIVDGLWRSGTADEAKFDGRALPTSWTQIEAGMAAMINLPVMLVSDPEVTSGVFEPELTDHKVFRLKTPPDALSREMKNWLIAVNERAARSTEVA